jgi:hypothetical protein
MSSREVFHVDIRHPGLNTYQRIRGTDRELVERRAAAKLAEWDERWARIQRLEAQRDQRQRRLDELLQNKWDEKRAKEGAKAHADSLTRAAEQAVLEASQLLSAALARPEPFTFESLRETGSFDEAAPSPPVLREMPPPPTLEPTHYSPPPTSGWSRALEAIVTPLKTRRLNGEAVSRASLEQFYRLQYEKELAAWEAESTTIRAYNQRLNSVFAKELAQWRARKAAFVLSQRAQNDRVDLLESEYRFGEREAIEQYCDLVLAGSHYPDSFPKTDELHYDQPAKQLELPPSNRTT